MQLAHPQSVRHLNTSAPAPGIEVEALTAPAHCVGGDFYDCFLVDDHRLAVVIADVSGKGVNVAQFVEASRSSLKQHAMDRRDPELVLQALNDELCAGNEAMMFVTAFFGVLDLRSGRLDFVNAGHNPPLIQGGPARIRMLPRSQNVALGVLVGARFRQSRASLRRGDTLLLYTDGVTEASDPSGRMFGEQRLLNVVMRHRSGHGSLPGELLRRVREFEGGKPQGDDIACVALRYLPVPGTLA